MYIRADFDVSASGLNSNATAKLLTASVFTPSLLSTHKVPVQTAVIRGSFQTIYIERSCRSSFVMNFDRNALKTVRFIPSAQNG